jgi:uncharacterized membrane protein
MPHRWSNTSDTRTLTLWPWRSLPRRGFAVIIMMTFLFITIPLYGLLGTIFFWGLLPFVMLALAGLWWALQHTYKTAEVLEVLTITPQEVHLTHQPRKGDILEWRCNTYWVRAQIYPTGGPVPQYVTLSGNGREVEIGSFLSEEERLRLIGELEQVLGEIKTGS